MSYKRLRPPRTGVSRQQPGTAPLHLTYCMANALAPLAAASAFS